MNTAEIHDRIQALKVEIRSVGKILDDRRMTERQEEDRRKDEITARIFNNTVKYQAGNDFPQGITENFIESVRSGKYD